MLKVYVSNVFVSAVSLLFNIVSSQAMYIFLAASPPRSGITQLIDVVPSPVQSVVISAYAWSVVEDLQSPFSFKVRAIVGVTVAIADPDAGSQADWIGAVVSQVRVNVEVLVFTALSAAENWITYVPSVEALMVVAKAVAVPKVIVPGPEIFDHW